MKSLFIVFVCLFLIIGLPYVFDQIKDAKTDESEVSFAGVTTGAGVYTANVTLPYSLYDNTTINVSDISSNLSGYDTPSAYSYNSVSEVLTVSGLDDSSTRTLTVDYLVTNTDLAGFFLTFLNLFPWFYILIIIGMTCGAIYAFWQD